MATSRAGDLLTELHRRETLALRAVTLRELLAMWPLFDLADIDASWARLSPAILALVRSRHDLAAQRADDGSPLHLRDWAALELLYATGVRVAELVGIDRTKDIAVLRIDAKSGALTPIARPPEGYTIEVGQKTIAIGNPFGMGQTVTQGIISATAHQVFEPTELNPNPGDIGVQYPNKKSKWGL